MGNKNSSSGSAAPNRTSEPKIYTSTSTHHSRHASSLFIVPSTLNQTKTTGSQILANLNDIRPTYTVEDILRRKSDSDKQICSLQPQRPAITPNFSNHAYDIFKKAYLNYRITPEDQFNFDARRNQNVDALLQESEQKIRQIQQQRQRLEASLVTNRESKKPSSSLESCVDQTDRFAKFRFWDAKYFAPKPERPELTDEMLRMIKDASRPEPASEVLVEIDCVQILRKDMRTLTHLHWLNDEIINAYFHLIVLRGREPKRKKVYAFNTFFYPKLRESGYNSVRRWTRKVDILSYDILLVPVHLGNHWCLGFISFPERKISYYDSMGGSTNNFCDTMLDYLRYESNDKKKQDFDDENWQSINGYAEGIPVQMNCSDCGVFACQFAEYLTRQAKLNFNQEHMPYFRQKMIYELLTKRILE